MPIYFLLSKRVLLSVGREPTLQAYFERGALFYNALTQPIDWREVQRFRRLDFLGGSIRDAGCRPGTQSAFRRRHSRSRHSAIVPTRLEQARSVDEKVPPSMVRTFQRGPSSASI